MRLFQTFEDFVFRAAFTDSKNIPGRKFVVILAERVRAIKGQSHCPLYRPANIYLLLRLYYTGTLHNKLKNPARNSNSSNVQKRP
jgi:hypothetical protein